MIIEAGNYTAQAKLMVQSNVRQYVQGIAYILCLYKIEATQDVPDYFFWKVTRQK